MNSNLEAAVAAGSPATIAGGTAATLRRIDALAVGVAIVATLDTKGEQVAFLPAGAGAPRAVDDPHRLQHPLVQLRHGPRGAA